MLQTVRLTITPDLEQALQILHSSTMGTLNMTELIKMAIGGYAQIKKTDITPKELDMISSQLFHKWAKEDGSINIDNIAHPDKLKPYTPRPYVRTR